ncbi:MAG TPA: Gfo/Idh/MocA family oxidoreductase [Roseiarcus sp.]|nr:Gfo/Idh/MocA family oxidoreductase [Roseiarcus sp.]
MSKDQAQLRVLVAGAGAFGAEHLARLAGRHDVAVAGVADIDPVALERAGWRAASAKLFADPLRLIDEVEADAIIVASPAATHIEIGLKALERNLAALIEKPIAPSASAAGPLVAAAQRSAGFVLSGHVLRFSRDHQHLVEVVRSGLIGEVLYVNSRRYRDVSHVVRYADIDPIYTTLIHDIDLAHWIAQSRFRSVRARRRGAGYRSLTAVSAITETGVVCDLRTAWTFPGDELPPDRLEVVGERGSVELVVGQGLAVYAEGRLTHHQLAQADDPLWNEQNHFLACVRDRSRAPALDLPEALAGLKLADAAIESLSLDREVRLGA